MTTETKISAAALGVMLSEKMLAVTSLLNEIEEIAGKLYEEEDTREVNDAFLETHQIHLGAMSNVIFKQMEKFPDEITRLRTVLYVRDWELVHGKGEWREIMKEHGHIIPAIRSLRMHANLSLHEAKLVLEAHRDGLIK